jgi:hypothetical protein
MDIIFINRKNEIIRSGERVKIEVVGKHLVLIDMEQKIMEIEEFKSEKRAEEKLREIGEMIIGRKKKEGKEYVMVVDLREEGGEKRDEGNKE